MADQPVLGDACAVQFCLGGVQVGDIQSTESRLQNQEFEEVDFTVP